MPFLGSRFVFTPLLAAIGAVLLFIAPAAGLAIESRALAVAPDLSHVSPRFPTLRPVTDLVHDPTTSTDAGFNTSVASIASTNISFLPSAGHAPSTGALPWSVTELTALQPTATSNTLPRAAADADVSVSTVSIASAEAPSPLLTDRASRLNPLPWSVSGSQSHSDYIPDQPMFNHATTAARDSAIAMVAGNNASIIVANQSHLASLTAFRPAVHHHRSLEPDSMPDLPTRSDPFADDLFADDSAILAIASIAAVIIASNQQSKRFQWMQRVSAPNRGTAGSDPTGSRGKRWNCGFGSNGFSMKALELGFGFGSSRDLKCMCNTSQ